MSRVLFVDDDSALCEAVSEGLTKRGFEVEYATSPKDALARILDLEVDVVLSDLRMPGMNGNELCQRITETKPDVPVVVATAFGNFEAAVDAIRAGAYDFVQKPFELDALALVLQRANKHKQLGDEIRKLRSETTSRLEHKDILGESAAIKRAIDLIERVGPTEVSVLITGESGTGKEMVARALHHASPRKDKKLVAINCAAVPEALLEAELFGHVKGAFTDASSSRAGLFAQAEGGTVFLDEIGDMPLSLQPKLLRVLQERTVRPVGSDVEKPVDVRVLAATHRDLEQAVAEDRFREDLFYRLKVVEIEVPPLRVRGNDILLLAQHFVQVAAKKHNKKVSGIAMPAAEKLLAYSWTGNVRELQNCIERAVVLTQHDSILVEDLSDRIRDHVKTRVVLDAEDGEELPSLEDITKRYVLRVMQAVGGNKRHAARVLGIDRKTLYRRLESYGIEVGNDKD